jgi:hypothetical protein
MNDPDVSLKVQIFLNFKYPELYNLWESDPCSYYFSDWEWCQK